MRLYSKFHDYYDTAIAYGIDELCFYQRKQQGFKPPEYRKGSVASTYNDIAEPFKDSIEHTSFLNARFAKFYILFCGRVYPGVRYHYDKNINSIEYYDKIVYDVEDALREHSKYRKRHPSRWYGVDRGAKAIKQHFSLKVPEEILINMHHKAGVPIILITGEKVVYNPKLLTYGFQKVVNATEAFQEISMFISGVLGGQSPKMVQLEDKDLIKKRGFNKLSFRKEKEK